MALKKLIDRLKKSASINVLKHLSQLVIGVLIARELGVEDKGLHFVFTSIAGAIAILGSFGFVNSIVFHAKKSHLNSVQVCLYCLLSIVILSITSALLYAGFSGFLNEMLFDGGQVNNAVLVLFGVYVLSSLLNYFVNSFCLAFGKMSLYFFCFAISSILCCLMVGVGALFYDFDIVDCLTVIVATELIFGFIAFCIICLDKHLFIVKEAKGLKSICDYAFKSYLGVSGSAVTSYGDSFILSAMFTQEMLGLYSVAKTIYRLFAIIPQTINSAIFGILCDVNREKAAALVKQVCLWLSALFLFTTIVGVFVLEEAITMLWGESFSNAFIPAIILMFAATLIASTAPMNPYFLTQNKPLWSSKITLVSGSASLLGCAILAPYLGLVGAALAILISASITSIMRVFYYRRLKF